VAEPNTLPPTYLRILLPTFLTVGIKAEPTFFKAGIAKDPNSRAAPLANEANIKMILIHSKKSPIFTLDLLPI
jgi:hypothetical protein